MTSSEDLVRQYYQALNSHDLDKSRQFLHSQYTFTDNSGNTVQGIQRGIEFETMLFNAFPDWKMNIKNIYSSGDTCIVEFTAEGTQKGQFMDIQPTNKKATVPVCGVLEVRDNKIISEREYWDNSLLLQQIGGQSRQAQA